MTISPLTALEIQALGRSAQPSSLPPIDVTDWIRQTMEPGIAAYALVLTPGSRWHVPADRLIGRNLELLQLVDLTKRWDLNVWQAARFEQESISRPLTEQEVEGWEHCLADAEQLDIEIEALRTRLGANS